MNVLDQKFAEFQKLSADEKINHFNSNGHLFDMIISHQMVCEILEDI